MLLKNCKLIKELSGGISYDLADIEIEGQTIKSVKKSKKNIKYDGQVLDLEGKYVLPGFFDLHIHLGCTAGRTLEDNIRPVATQVLEGLRFAQDTLRAGFTTIRDVGSAHGIATGLRDAIQSGIIEGPNIVACDKVLTPTEIGNDYFAGLYVEFNGADYAIQRTREIFQAGADFVKVMGSGAFMNPGGKPGEPICLDEELEAIQKIVAMKNSHAAVHAHGAEAIKQAIRCKIRCIEHGSLVDEEGIEMLRDSDSYLVPTAIAMFNWDEDTKKDAKQWAYISGLMEEIEKSLSAAYKAGLKLGFGTDTGVPECYHGKNADEFAVRHERLKMAPLDILLQATKYSAEIIQLDHMLGTIEEGKMADLVVLDCDPLQEISKMGQAIRMVIKSGKIVEGEKN